MKISKNEFPSPYGVSFILMSKNWYFKLKILNLWVSVSLRSIIHSYPRFFSDDNIYPLLFPSPYGVSFILISYIASISFKFYVSFRLLTEYHSFLCFILFSIYSLLFSFRLLTEYHSFLWYSNIKDVLTNSKFPSPYGVSFILIIGVVKYETNINIKVSVSLRSIIHSYKINTFYSLF